MAQSLSSTSRFCAGNSVSVTWLTREPGATSPHFLWKFAFRKAEVWRRPFIRASALPVEARRIACWAALKSSGSSTMVSHPALHLTLPGSYGFLLSDQSEWSRQSLPFWQQTYIFYSKGSIIFLQSLPAGLPGNHCRAGICRQGERHA